jgi:uncharacterized protein (TIGR03437 family)
VPIQIALQTSPLAKGLYTAVVTVSDPNAVNAPQFISVTVLVGGILPDRLDFYVPPQGIDVQGIGTGGTPTIALSTQSGGNWLSIAATVSGAFTKSYEITANGSGLAPGDYQGQIVFSGSSFSLDNKTVPITLHVTTQPILKSDQTSLDFTITSGSLGFGTQTKFFNVTNRGQGTLVVDSAGVSRDSIWMKATLVTGPGPVTSQPMPVSVLAGTATAPKVFHGIVLITGNAVNSPLQVPATLTTVEQGPPIAYTGGAVNNATFASGEFLAQGDITALFGRNLAFLGGYAGSIPLPTTLDDTQLFLNDQPVPLFYVADGQIDFQVPFSTPAGEALLRVVHFGKQGNTISVNISPRVPRLFYYPPAPPMWRAGDTVVVYGIGFGQTTPPVETGKRPPSDSLAIVPGNSQVCFGSAGPSQHCVSAAFTGLSPAYVGLYQVNFTIPLDTPKGSVPVTVVFADGTISNVVPAVIQ